MQKYCHMCSSIFADRHVCNNKGSTRPPKLKSSDLYVLHYTATPEMPFLSTCALDSCLLFYICFVFWYNILKLTTLLYLFSVSCGFVRPLKPFPSFPHTFFCAIYFLKASNLLFFTFTKLPILSLIFHKHVAAAPYWSQESILLPEVLFFPK